jgi:hypothetical protein
LMSCQQNVLDFCLLPTAPRPERSRNDYRA